MIFFYSADGVKGIVGDIGFQGPVGLPGLDGLPGLRGDIGFPGLQGDIGYSIPGIKGERGDVGLPGFDGIDGLDGEVGDIGETGAPGFRGRKGERGLIGDIGEEGFEGREGLIGLKGMKGDPAPLNQFRPKPGYDGLRGEKGETGDKGFPGTPGLVGYRGLKGYQGLQGLTGLPGAPGLKGEKGFRGPPGVNGLDGFRGPPGENGDDAPPPPPPKSRGFVFTRHSQSVTVPRCPVNTNLLWEGYSFVSIIGSGRSVGQDLGTSGSCLRQFSTMPFMFCNLNNVCSYAENNDDSIWLTTGEPMPMSMTPIPAREMEKYVSRCAVCETTTRLIALHSQSMEIPDCPQGWEEAWIGYSYYMQTSDANGNSHQNLISPGSCLEEFRAQPVIECHGRGSCNIFDGITSFWLTVIEDSEQFRKPKQQTLKADQTSKISRCSVCRKMDNSLRSRTVSRVQLPNASAFSQRETEISNSFRSNDVTAINQPEVQRFPQPPRRRPRPGSRTSPRRSNRSRDQQQG
ncbi:hypothetical protein PVAND_005803 [Polypedilum vanderplanki]|uniref:Collagen IV NC1 domain-containing protein n=1 Tax=Polypedilum vanderplanki TaxID=319348 RepID=A0A9J6C1Q6_POLVA|nr:hypothetical protein PVAND_005803 [Polypedilum vanderplanki]